MNVFECQGLKENSNKFSVFSVVKDAGVWIVILTLIVLYFVALKLPKYLQNIPKRGIHSIQLITGLFFMAFLPLYENFITIALSNFQEIETQPFFTFDELLDLLEARKCVLITHQSIYKDYDALFPKDNNAQNPMWLRLLKIYEKNPPIIFENSSISFLLDHLVKIETENLTCATIVDYGSRLSMYKMYNLSLGFLNDNRLTKIPFVYFYRKSLSAEHRNILTRAFAQVDSSDILERISIDFVAEKLKEHERAQNSSNFKVAVLESIILGPNF